MQRAPGKGFYAASSLYEMLKTTSCNTISLLLQHFPYDIVDLASWLADQQQRWCLDHSHLLLF